MGFTCLLYEGAEWCTHKGEKGPGWADFWPNFQKFSSHGMSAKQACCGCGGGNTDPNQFDKNSPEYNGIPPYAEVLFIYIAKLF